MNKSVLLQSIIEKLSADLNLFTTAARAAHEAATHEENQPDNKYDTLALEASYVAQGQANRAQELRRSIEIYRQLKPHGSHLESVRLTSLVTLEDADSKKRSLFVGPAEGGLKLLYGDEEIVVITPGSPLGRELIGKIAGDTVEIETGGTRAEYEIVEVC